MSKEILELAVETLRRQVASLRQEIEQLKEELKSKNKLTKEGLTERENRVELDELLTTKAVQRILGVCYNTLQNNIVKKGLLEPKKLSARKIRYSKRELINYIDSLSNQL